ncbi:MAG: hypothetical protein WBM28_04850, partial [Burkholderiales bacterium]
HIPKLSSIGQADAAGCLRRKSEGRAEMLPSAPAEQAPGHPDFDAKRVPSMCNSEENSCNV